MFWTYLVLTCCATIADARIGESEKQCDARYGKPEKVEAVEPGESARRYKKDGKVITLEFVKGKAVVISFVNEAESGKPPAEIKPEERKKLMEEHAGDKKWETGYGRRRIHPLPVAYEYRYRHPERSATYSEIDRIMRISDKEHAAKVDAIKAAAAKKAMAAHAAAEEQERKKLEKKRQERREKRREDGLDRKLKAPE